MKIIRSLAVLSGLAVSAAAGATTWGQDPLTGIAFTAVAGVGNGSIYCNTTTCNNTGGLGVNQIIMTAYQTPFNTGDSTTSPTENNGTASLWLPAKIQTYLMGSHVGVGITGVDDPTTGTGAETMIDNNGVDDILVVDFGSPGWDVSSFSVGHACNATSSVTPACPVVAVDVSAWLSNTLPTAFTGNAGAAIPNNGAVALTLSGDPSGIGQRGVGGTNTGRYLIITGATTTATEAFTIKGISADKVSGGTQVPLPGSAPLVALGLLAMAWAYSRRTIPARIRV